MKYRLTEDLPMLEYKKGHVFDGNPVFKTRYENVTWNEEVNPVELSLLLKTGILEEVKEDVEKEIEKREVMDENFSKVYPREVKEEEWPTRGEKFYAVEFNGQVGSYMWTGGRIDDALSEYGNIFRSETEAKEASEKIKTLLLSLKK